jgi:hypothetical protein
MGVLEAQMEWVEAKEFFAREFLLEDLRGMVARLLGKGGGSGEIDTTPRVTPRRTAA